MAHSPAYSWFQLTVEASYKIPERMRGQCQKDRAATSTCKRAPKSSSAAGPSACHGYQNAAIWRLGWLPEQLEESSNPKKVVIQTPCRHFGHPTHFMPTNDSRSREVLCWICGGLFESWDKYIGHGPCDKSGKEQLSSQQTRYSSLSNRQVHQTGTQLCKDKHISCFSGKGRTPIHQHQLAIRELN